MMLMRSITQRLGLTVVLCAGTGLCTFTTSTIQAAEVSGTLIKWYPIRVDFEGPQLSESTGAENHTFLNHRLVVTFTGPSNQVYEVPGFFAGNGHGASPGNIWRANFSADEPGIWRYKASFRKGTDVAVSLDAEAGEAISFDGEQGHFEVAPLDSNAPGFLKWGRL